MYRIRQNIKDRLPTFDVMKLFLNATHTRTAPELKEGRYTIPDKDVIQPEDYARFLIECLSNLIIIAWESRKPGAVSRGLGHAVVAQNRRAVYADRHAKMYGRTDVPEFINLEGYEDHDIGTIFFWSQDMKLLAVTINVACPAQVVENDSTIDADFWHEVREKLRQKYSQDLLVLGWIGAAGDQSPHPMYHKRAGARMRKLLGINQKQEIAGRICQAVDEGYKAAKIDIRKDVQMVHKVQQIKLPVRRVSDGEVTSARLQIENLSADPSNKTTIVWHEDVIARYPRQKTNPYYDMELHVVRIGDIVICTNPFELFTDFGIRIKARSKALQTFVIQLTGKGGYVPTEKAVRGGGYGAIIQSNLVGPEGGQILIDRTVEAINDLWEKSH